MPAVPVAKLLASERDSSAPFCGHRLEWAAFLAQTFVTELCPCAACGGRLRIIAAVTDPASSSPNSESPEPPATFRFVRRHKKRIKPPTAGIQPSTPNNSVGQSIWSSVSCGTLPCASNAAWSRSPSQAMAREESSTAGCCINACRGFVLPVPQAA